MAIIKPFKAYRPIEELASKIAALPYDVMNTEEAREMAKGNKYSFLYVDRGEINFPEKVNIYGEEVYKESREVLDKMIENKYYFQDKNPYFYIYQPQRKLTYQVISAFKYDDRHIMNSFNFYAGDDLNNFQQMILDPSSPVRNVRQNLDKTIDKNSKIVVFRRLRTT